MAIYGLDLNKQNPEFTVDDFLLWCPAFRRVITEKLFIKLVNIANKKIFYDIYGSDWEQAMALCMAHYLTLIGNNRSLPVANNFKNLVGGDNFNGVVSSMSVGDYSKSVDVNFTLSSKPENRFWNLTSYGMQLVALKETKAIATIFVVAGD